MYHSVWYIGTPILTARRHVVGHTDTDMNYIKDVGIQKHVNVTPTIVTRSIIYLRLCYCWVNKIETSLSDPFCAP